MIDATAAVPTLGVKGLSLAYDASNRPLHVLQHVDLEVQAGEVVGLVGESGSGKSTLAFACMRYLSSNATVLDGDIAFEGRSLLAASEPELTRLRGKRLAMVYQDPNTSLNPTLTIGLQIAEVLQRHQGLSASAARRRAVELLRSVNLSDPDGAMHKIPHQLSGGEKQRILIAIAFSCKPGLLILDEPTTALDPTTAAGVLDLIRQLQRETRVAALFITHDLGTVASIAQRLDVIYAGRIVESGPTSEVLRNPRHPYTRMLLASAPGLASASPGERLTALAGPAPDLTRPPTGCIFQGRCPFVTDACTQRPVELSAGAHRVACVRYPKIAGEAFPTGQDTRSMDDSRVAGASSEPGDRESPLLIAEHIEVGYRRRGRSIARDARVLRAVRDVELHVDRGETLALVGESGSGKSSLARALVGLEAATGTLRVGAASYRLPARLGRDYRQRVQIIFQNPDQSLNPRQTVATILTRPLVLRGVPRRERTLRVGELLAQVRLPAAYAAKFPHQLSGGEKQRVAIARAFATRPELVICDEITSALDVSVQASIVNLLSDLQDEHGTAYLFISHDLDLVRRIADRVAVMYLGEILETGAASELFEPPYHPYTEALLSAVPSPLAEAQRRPIRLHGDPPGSDARPAGCPFASRCPRRIGQVCDDVPPPVVAFGAGHALRCHIPLDTLRRAPPVPVDSADARGTAPQLDGQP